MDSCIVNIENDEIFDDFRYANFKTLIFQNFSSEISIRQDFRLGKGGILWDASYLLAKFLTSFDLSQKNVLELGAATALPSIVAVTLGANVWASDINPALRLTEASADLNRSIIGESLKIIELDWCQVSHRSRAEGVDFDELADDFIQTLLHFCRAETITLICYKHRIDSIVVPYLERLSTHFDLQYHQEFLKTIYKGETTFLISAKRKTIHNFHLD